MGKIERIQVAPEDRERLVKLVKDRNTPQKIVCGPRANAHELYVDDTNADPSDSGLARRTATWLAITSQKILRRPLDTFSAITPRFSFDDATTVSVARLGLRDGSNKHLI